MWCGAPSFGADSLVSHLLIFVNIPHCWPPASRISSNGSTQSFFWCALTELGELAYYAACRSGTIIVWFLQVTYLFPWRLLFVAHLPLVVLKPVILVLLGWPSQISSVDFQYFNDGMHRKSHVPHSSSLSIVFSLGAYYFWTTVMLWRYRRKVHLVPDGENEQSFKISSLTMCSLLFTSCSDSLTRRHVTPTAAHQNHVNQKVQVSPNM